MTESEEELKSLLMKLKKLRSWHPVPSLHGKKMGKQWKQWETIFLDSKITADGDCSHEIKRHLLLGRKAMTNKDSVLKSRDITLPTKVHIVKAYLSSSHAHKEGWAPKNYCFWTMLRVIQEGAMNKACSLLSAKSTFWFTWCLTQFLNVMELTTINLAIITEITSEGVLKCSLITALLSKDHHSNCMLFSMLQKNILNQQGGNNFLWELVMGWLVLHT